MRRRLIQWVGIAWTLLYASLVVWVYATAPQSVRDVATGASVAAGTYEGDRARFDAGRALFLREQYAAARDEWARPHPARRDHAVLRRVLLLQGGLGPRLQRRRALPAGARRGRARDEPPGERAARNRRPGA